MHSIQSALAGFLLVCWCLEATGSAHVFPALPTKNGVVTIPAHEWPEAPGARSIDVHVRYPEGRRDAVDADTGLMLSLHNWGGTEFRGAPDPQALTTALDVIVIGVDYVQSGPFDASTAGPYDCGLYQAIDAIHALAWVWHGLDTLERPFARARIYTTGGSGGGNVSLMANKLATRTFAAVIDLSGMARLSDDIAYGEAGGSSLNAGYSRDASSSQSLSESEQLIRDPGYPPHLNTMADIGNAAALLSVHGSEDTSCLFTEKWEVIANMHAAGLNARLHGVFPAEALPDERPEFLTIHAAGNPPFANARHSLGNRTAILMTVAKPLLELDSPDAALRKGKSDFDQRDAPVRYTCPDGVFIVDYRSGYPLLRFDPNSN